jgi:predicted flap endonuclease-1-like 5' DNA nuclease
MIKKNFLKKSPLCKVTFTLPKEAVQGANEVRVLGDFNQWNWEKGVPMTEGDDAYFAEVGLEAGQTYEFRYRTDNFQWENDWAADKYVASPFLGVTNSVIELPTTFKIAEAPVKAPANKKTVAKKTVAKVKATPKAKTTKVEAKTTKVVTKKVAAKPVAKKVAAKKTVATKKATTVKAKGADNLTKIEGIGPKIASLLIADGIDTFAKLSKAEITKLEEILKNAGPRFKMHVPTTWAEQARLATKGDWATLNTLQEELKGGKRK